MLFEAYNQGKILKTTTEKRLWYEIAAPKFRVSPIPLIGKKKKKKRVNPMTLNLNRNIDKIIDGDPYFLCFCTVSWFSNISSWFSKIFHASLLLLAHRNILFHLILVGGRYLDQVPRCQAISSNNSPYSRRIPLMWSSHVLIEVTRVIKIKFLNFFFCLWSY